MTNKDLISQYVDTGLKLPEYQINKLSKNDNKTYIRKRIISVNNFKFLEVYEQEIFFSNLPYDELLKTVNNEVNDVFKKNIFFNIGLYKVLPNDIKIKLINLLIDNDSIVENEMVENSPIEIKNYYLDKVMSDGLDIHTTVYLNFSKEEEIQYFKSLIKNKKTTQEKWYKLMPDNLKLEFLRMVIDHANETKRFIGSWVKDEYKKFTGKDLVRNHEIKQYVENK